jgi:hypothetical protein
LTQVIDLVGLPKEVMTLMNDRNAAKVLGTRSKNGDVHLINVGGAGAIDPETIFVGEIFMRATGENLTLAKAEGTRASVLCSKGFESYEIKCSVKDHVTSGPMFDQMKATFAQMKFNLHGLWLLKPEEIWNESPTWDQGRKIA